MGGGEQGQRATLSTGWKVPRWGSTGSARADVAQWPKVPLRRSVSPPIASQISATVR